MHAATVHLRHPAQRFDVHAVHRPEWLSDLLSVRLGRYEASLRAGMQVLDGRAAPSRSHV